MGRASQAPNSILAADQFGLKLVVRLGEFLRTDLQTSRTEDLIAIILLVSVGNALDESTQADHADAHCFGHPLLISKC